MSNGIDALIGPRPGLSLVMPAYNEEAGIQTVLAEAAQHDDVGGRLREHRHRARHVIAGHHGAVVDIGDHPDA